jgi:hypothetical protein
VRMHLVLRLHCRIKGSAKAKLHVSESYVEYPDQRRVPPRKHNPILFDLVLILFSGFLGVAGLRRFQLDHGRGLIYVFVLISLKWSSANPR